MAKKPTARTDFVLVNVTYEDGSQKSNRKVPADAFEDPFDRDKAVRDAIEAQDKAISEKSGLPPLPIRSIVRVK